jgi:hypothetical protein
MELKPCVPINYQRPYDMKHLTFLILFLITHYTLFILNTLGVPLRFRLSASTHRFTAFRCGVSASIPHALRYLYSILLTTHSFIAFLTFNLLYTCWACQEFDKRTILKHSK